LSGPPKRLGCNAERSTLARVDCAGASAQQFQQGMVGIAGFGQRSQVTLPLRAALLVSAKTECAQRAQIVQRQRLLFGERANAVLDQRASAFAFGSIQAVRQTGQLSVSARSG